MVKIYWWFDLRAGKRGEEWAFNSRWNKCLVISPQGLSAQPYRARQKQKPGDDRAFVFVASSLDAASAWWTQLASRDSRVSWIGRRQAEETELRRQAGRQEQRGVRLAILAGQGGDYVSAAITSSSDIALSLSRCSSMSWVVEVLPIVWNFRNFGEGWPLVVESALFSQFGQDGQQFSIRESFNL
jgi:hypothetical protein